jgi:hypothetical protein
MALQVKNQAQKLFEVWRFPPVNKGLGGMVVDRRDGP